MSQFWLFGVWILVFGMVQCNVSPETDSLSHVDVKDLMQRVILLEESLRKEKERNDELQEKVNSLVTNLEETKRTCSALEKQLQEHQDFETRSGLFTTHQGVENKTQKIKNDHKPFIDWHRPWYPLLKTHESNAAPEVREKISSPNLQSMYNLSFN